MIESGWLVRYVPAEVAQPAVPLPGIGEFPGGWSEWLAEEDILVGTPYLISPRFEYDVELNEFFRSAVMVGRAWTTQAGYAGDVKAFLNVLWRARGGRSWRDATEADHLAYLVWRRKDVRGPRVDDATWDREVTAVNRFYAWQVRAGHVRVTPIPQRQRRPAPVHSGRVGPVGGEAPATLSHGAGRDRIAWFPPVSYRQWRDVGVRGYTAEGMPDPGFRGRWAARNATFCDLMVRTGMRLSEQAALTVFEVPLGRGRGGYQRFWLPAAIAKGGSARWVYVPSSVAGDLADYVEFDRAEVVAQARVDGRYRRWRRPLVVEDPTRPVVRTASGHRTKVSLLDPVERRQLLVDGPDGLEPAVVWLSEFGTPIATSTWKDMFGAANRRCRSHGVRLRGHAHLLRHSYAVITLEQMQRGHIAALAEMTPGQRESYVRIFGDPLNWVRCRLGHASVVTTQIYLHFGTSDSGFRAEVESEQALARGEHLLAMIDVHEHDQLAGPAAEEAARRLTEFGDQARFRGSLVLDERRLARVMARNDPAVYPSKYITYVHKHETALCQQRRDSRGELRPDQANCQPLTCRNVALTADNITTWQQETDRIDRELAQRPLLPPLHSQQLRQRRDAITSFLTQHTQDRP